MLVVPIRTTAPPDYSDAFARAANISQADIHIGAAIEVLGDAIGEVFRHRCTLGPQERRAEEAMRNALVALAHAREWIEPHMSERGA